MTFEDAVKKMEKYLYTMNGEYIDEDDIRGEAEYIVSIIKLALEEREKIVDIKIIRTKEECDECMRIKSLSGLGICTPLVGGCTQEKEEKEG